MKNNLIKTFILAALLTGGLASCKKELNRNPINTATADVVYSTAVGYKEALAKVYGAYALTGSTGSSSSDLGGIDAGTSDFLRLYWNAQELPTDEAICAWGDVGLHDFHDMNWTSSNTFLNGLYTRCVYQITVANSFIAQSTDDKLASRGITGADADNVRHYRAEARFLRAYQYWVLMDLFASPPFVDENSPIGKVYPTQISRADLFAYVESELKAIDASLVAPRANEYGRADQAADWALLSRLYLNAEVYLGSGKGRYTDAATYAAKVIGSGYTLNTSYANLFKGDNNLNNPETILSINYDGVNSQTYGGTTFLINSCLNSALNPAAYGVASGGWGGNRAVSTLPATIFGDYSGNTDKRAMFAGPKITNDDESTFTDGLAVVKFTNMTSAGVAAASPNGVFCSTDFPIFRLAEMYLTYSEALLRGGTGTAGSALQYFNLIRTRAYGNTSGNVSSITLNDILNERGREFYFEAARRTDLIRFGLFNSSSYVWPWKGGVIAGKGVESFRTIYPIPAPDLSANPNLKQNTGY
ncbi:RagB/SusD family nutrient uptake outer membrane protein [Mucilaginibacter polytrichastri]|uniref:RagB/SusD domain-containing protein n=1 Tax=Mucilaginibacter polytrichastri TaxID=1302689 RepID=A0A1Q5ZUT4_9SPHI|nr:RagB/SusD family nutrient uptake outer membrane protein [Mucilaginibacter polytrichastri]OKS85516.1 hypothetical protein RG47T_0962 [Mucilaginibacter polytrichastri]SFS37421.1 Starch-binding associating with outer membrane [Mucilaginibacter polytrichastri]